MSEGTTFTAALDQAAGALDVLALKVQLIAFNVANISTLSFRPAHLELASGPGGKGVRVDALMRDDGGSLSSASPEESFSSAELCEVSGTDLAKEFAQLIEAKNSFIASARVIGVIDDLNDSVLNIKT